ncbi:putative beta-galactosidase [Calycina marina]|uniref:Beta-galactosidase n=1 Tax=Calycina marina TaxID=1763456 RepID=A0A9P7Z3N1_9HELO|nr:putative beta-galactosidase [Calycina marina]
MANRVTYDDYSLFIRGERVFIFSGESHLHLLPATDLWLDVFQKTKGLCFNTVSYYVYWAPLEGEEGVYVADGIFAFEPFLDAAKQAGIYLLARPGPVSSLGDTDLYVLQSQHINAEASGGGFPGWLQRINGQLRTRAPGYLSATDNYITNTGAIIAKAQVANGGPIILVQPEIEVSGAVGAIDGFTDLTYFAYVKQKWYNAGIIVLLTQKDAWAQGLFASG